MSRGSRSAAPASPAPFLGRRVRPSAPLAPTHVGAATQPRAVGPQQVTRAAAAAARAGGATRGRRQGSAPTACSGRRRRVLLRARCGVGPRGGGHADPQLCASRSQPNGQVLHVLRAAAPSSHTPGERAYDARRPPAPAWKSHPVVGGIALTPRYSPKPRLDNVRPAAAPPEEPEPDQPDDSDAPEAHAGALVGSLSPPTPRQNDSASVSQGLAGPS